jgi:hypothetical protein
MKIIKNLQFNWIPTIILAAFVLVTTLFKIQYGTNGVIIIILLLGVVLKDGVTLIKDWLPPLSILYMYEVLRAEAFDLAQDLGRVLIVDPLISFESAIFSFIGDIPTVILQEFFQPVISSPNWYDYVFLIFYGIFFWGWAIAGFYFWTKDRLLFKQYIYGLVLFSLLSVVVFVLYPTAPPWYASDIGAIGPVDRVLWESRFFGNFSFYGLQEVGRNDFAAVPSHHTAWTFYMALFFVYHLGKKGLIFFIIPFGVAFATWYGAEHYVFDSIIGMLFATVSFIIAIRFERIYPKLKNIVGIKNGIQKKRVKEAIPQ